MSVKEFVRAYKGILLGIVAGLLISLLSFFGIINILEGVFLFIVSIPISIWIQFHKLVFLKNDLISVALFTLTVLAFFGLWGQLVFILRSKPKVIKYWFFITLLIILNVVSYWYSKNFLDSFAQAIQDIIG